MEAYVETAGSSGSDILRYSRYSKHHTLVNFWSGSVPVPETQDWLCRYVDLSKLVCRSLGALTRRSQCVFWLEHNYGYARWFHRNENISSVWCRSSIPSGNWYRGFPVLPRRFAARDGNPTSSQALFLIASWWSTNCFAGQLEQTVPPSYTWPFFSLWGLLLHLFPGDREGSEAVV